MRVTKASLILLQLVILSGCLADESLKTTLPSVGARMTPLQRITERISRQGHVNDPNTPRPLLTLSEFFDGNELAGSIGCNLIPTPEPAEFRSQFARIAARSDVADIRVQITDFDDPAWPFSDTVWVITNAAPEEVRLWFDERLRPDDCWQGWTAGCKFEPYTLPAGMHPIACWWD